jgi:hypothetical protein
VGTPAADATTFSDNTGVANTAYDYRVFAVNVSGDSPASNTATATTLPNPPAAASALNATPISSSRIDLTWTDNATTETSYRVERSPAGAGTWASVGTPAADATTFTNDTGLNPNTAYDYRVFAVNSGGDSPASNTASATTLPAPHPTPSTPDVR